MRSPYEDFVGASDSEEAKNSAIPYHARENSLPFSYGQINKTSTPLRNGSGGGGGGLHRTSASSNANRLDFSAGNSNDANLNASSDRFYSNGNRGFGATTANAIPGSGADANTIKAQPRLTSPILVRKTLNSRSPTRNGSSSNNNGITTTNTIANTYHYNYGNGGGSNASGLNGNISYNNGNNDSIYSGILRKSAAPRNDLEESLRECREKVFNEYRSTAHDPPSSYGRQQPEPPLRQHHLSSASGSVARLANGHGQSPAQAGRKYNYDFEFHLNLDDVPPPPRRANTMERSSLQQYRTRDIPVARETAYVERNYHTISSSNAIRETAAAERPPLESVYNRRFQSQQLQQHQHQRQQQQQLPQPQQQIPPPQQQQPYVHLQRPEYAAYGNGNASGYATSSSSTYNEYRGSLGGARSRNDLSSSIYATSAKQVAATTYRHAIEPELSTTDYATPSKAGMVSPSASLVSRLETPAFPVTPRTPYGSNNGYNTPIPYQRSPIPQRSDFSNGQQSDTQNYSSETIYQTNCRPRLNSNLSMVNSEPQEVAAHLVKFAKDSSKFWYKPNLSREEAISLLLHAAPGTFVVRDSTTYKSAYGLVLRVAQPPPGNSSGKQEELVRHFLIEPTTRGVRLKGCANEPVFTSLSALVYEHSINQLALPCLLRIPELDLVPPLNEPTPAQKQLLTQGAACNVLWLYSCETESLTGEEAIRKAIRQLYAQNPLPKPTTEVHFKVSQLGITLTDNTRKKFFRKHYTADIISYCAIDPDHRLWTMEELDENGKNTAMGGLKKTIFAFVARRSPSSKDNQCHVFCDLAVTQPASAIVSFVNKTLPTEQQRNYVL